ncbi:MAG: VOC family protein [Gammaproteobacteria bacterium]|nr:VOC family protein [Gammaproteobacteria bacterium]MDH4254709.1 VOC family protein [Gammaproteobacteria bacterium]MDH5308812.1 VOC family protein [Gammaproteobacteria bacterium]
MGDKLNIGRIGWVDITVDDAAGLRDFYAHVVGWKPENVDMGTYSDFNMTMPESGIPAAGICHARGSNAGLPRQWLVYLVVADVAASARECVERGGELLVEPRGLAGGRFCVIRDPAGAVAALYQEP